MAAFPGELKRGVLMKQGHVVKSWKERVFVLFADRLVYFEHEAGKLPAKPKGTIQLAEVFQCVALPGASFSLTVGDPFGAGSAPPVEYVMMAANDTLQREWVAALQKTICRPLDAAQVLQAMLGLQKSGALCSRAQELLRRWLGVGSPEALRQAKALLEICGGIRPGDRCGDRVESLMVDLAVADTEAALLAVMRGLTVAFVKDYAPPSLRDRLVRAAMVLYERSTVPPPPQPAAPQPQPATPPPPAGSAATPPAAADALARPAPAPAAAAPEIVQYPWTPRVQQEFGLVLHAIAVFDHAERMRQQAAARQTAARRAAEASGQALLAPCDVPPDSDDFGLYAEDAGSDVDEVYSLCSCECAVCAEEERVQAAAAPPAPVESAGTGESGAPAVAEAATAASTPIADAFSLLKQPRAFAEDYELGRRLGEGAYSTVYQARHRSSGEEVAVKVAPKVRLSPSDITRLMEEVTTMASLSHPNIVRFIALYEDDTDFRIVTELMGGGELFDQIVSRSNYGEHEACEVIRTLARVIAYLHSQGIVHRDIKPENLLLASAPEPPPSAEKGPAARPARPAQSKPVALPPPPTPAVVIKLADFGFAKRIAAQDALAPPAPAAPPAMAAAASAAAPAAAGSAGAVASTEPPPPASIVPAAGVFSTSCGTPSYVAPEILRGESYGAAVDLWSLGVLTYILLCGYAPFTSSGSQPELFRRIMTGRFSFDPAYWSGVSAAAKDLISQLLRVDPTKRATAAAVLSHPWILGAVSSVELSFTLAQMRLFQQRKREILRCGFLVKQGAFVRNFKRRFFVLTSDELAYYDPEDLPPALQVQLAAGGGAELRWVTDLKARPRGSIRLQGVSVVAARPLPAATCPKFPSAAAPAPSGGNVGSARSTSTDVPSLRGPASDAPAAVSPRGGPSDATLRGDGASLAASSSPTPSLTLVGREGGASSSAATLVPCTAAGDFRWGLRLSSPPSLIGGLTGRDYNILADSAEARDAWVTAVSSVHLRGDLVRRAGVAMAMGDAHVKDAVGLMRMAQEWQETVMQGGSGGGTQQAMAAAPGSSAAAGMSPGRRRRRQSRHPPLDEAGRVPASRAGGGCGVAAASAPPSGHAKVCKHSSSADLGGAQALTVGVERVDLAAASNEGAAASIVTVVSADVEAV